MDLDLRRPTDWVRSDLTHQPLRTWEGGGVKACGPRIGWGQGSWNGNHIQVTNLESLCASDENHNAGSSNLPENNWQTKWTESDADEEVDEAPEPAASDDSPTGRWIC